MNTNGDVLEKFCSFFVSIAKIFKSPQRNWWDFLVETLHSIANKFNVELSMLHAKQDWSKSDLSRAICYWEDHNVCTLTFIFLFVCLQYGLSVSPYAGKRITHKPGWAFIMVSGECYELTFENAGHISNISYDGAYYYFGVSSYFI
jgi:hypothetical protein